MTIKEIAQLLNITPAAVRHIERRALAKLRRRLATPEARRDFAAALAAEERRKTRVHAPQREPK